MEDKKIALNSKKTILNSINNKENTLDTMNVNSKHLILNNLNNSKNIKLNKALKNIQTGNSKSAKLNETKNAKNIRLNEILGNTQFGNTKTIKSNGTKSAKNIRLNEALKSNNEASQQHLPSKTPSLTIKNPKEIALNKILGNSNRLNKRMESKNLDDKNNNNNKENLSTTIHL